MGGGRRRKRRAPPSRGIAPGGAPRDPARWLEHWRKEESGVLISKPSPRRNEGHTPTPASKWAAYAMCAPELGPLEVCVPKSIVPRKRASQRLFHRLGLFSSRSLWFDAEREDARMCHSFGRWRWDRAELGTRRWAMPLFQQGTRGAGSCPTVS